MVLLRPLERVTSLGVAEVLEAFGCLSVGLFHAPYSENPDLVHYGVRAEARLILALEILLLIDTVNQFECY